MRAKHLFIVGAPKTGTTSLALALGRHSSVQVSTPKEPNYFAQDIVKNGMSGPLSSYISRCFESNGTTTTDDLVRIDASTNYIYSAEAAGRILGTFPDAKFVVGVREPGDFCVSLHGELVKTGVQNIDAFEGAWRVSAGRAKGNSVPRFCEVAHLLDYADVARHGHYVSRLLGEVGRDAVLFYSYDDIRQDFVGLCRRILRFVDLDYQPEVVMEAANASGLPRSSAMARATHFGQQALRSLGFSGFFGVGQMVRSLNTVKGRSLADAGLVATINEQLREDSLLLRSLTDLKLDGWSCFEAGNS